jgi:putative oxidoreductase
VDALRSSVWSLVALLARAGIGTVFLAYGYDKLQNPDAVEQFFTSLGVPRPDLTVTVVTWVELGGGGLLIAGLLLPLAGTALAALMVGAWWYTQQPEAVLVLPRETYELELALAVGALLIGFSGGGKVSLDHLFSSAAGRARRAQEDSRFYVTESRLTADDEYPSPEYPSGQYFPTMPQPPQPQAQPGQQRQPGPGASGPPGGTSTAVLGQWSHQPGGEGPRR